MKKTKCGILFNMKILESVSLQYKYYKNNTQFEAANMYLANSM